MAAIHKTALVFLGQPILRWKSWVGKPTMPLTGIVGYGVQAHVKLLAPQPAVAEILYARRARERQGRPVAEDGHRVSRVAGESGRQRPQGDRYGHELLPVQVRGASRPDATQRIYRIAESRQQDRISQHPLAVAVAGSGEKGPVGLRGPMGRVMGRGGLWAGRPRQNSGFYQS